MVHPLQLVYQGEELIGFPIPLKGSIQTLSRNFSLLPGHHLAPQTWQTAGLEDHSWRCGSLLLQRSLHGTSQLLPPSP